MRIHRGAGVWRRGPRSQESVSRHGGSLRNADRTAAEGRRLVLTRALGAVFVSLAGLAAAIAGPSLSSANDGPSLSASNDVPAGLTTDRLEQVDEYERFREELENLPRVPHMAIQEAAR